MNENASVTARREKLEQERMTAMWEGYMSHIDEAEVDEGLVEGNESNVNVLPPWYFDRPLSRLSNRQRAYFVGREIRLYELAEERKK